MKDEILADLWKTKDRIARESDYKSQKLYERSKLLERALDRPVVNRSGQHKHQFDLKSA